MPIVQVEEHIGLPAERVWRAICDVEAFPIFMPPVQAIRVLRRDDTSLDAEWEVELKGSLLKWVQRDHHDEDRLRVDYHQISGDLERFEGYWLVEASPGGCVSRLLVDFEIGIPMLRMMLDPIATRALRENATTMLRSLQAREEVG